MSELLEKAWEKVSALPADQQDAIASQILDELADEEEWQRRFATKSEVLRRMANDALRVDTKGETVPLDDLL